MARAKCPICGGLVEIPDDALPGEVLEHDCGIMLEVFVDGERVSLKPAEGISEDWGE